MLPTTFTHFQASLTEPLPPADLSPGLLAIWHGLRGEWDKAHELIQAVEDDDSAWIHAWLHRVEGDSPNARYWYGLAGRPVGQGDTRAEGLAIVTALLGPG